jgi:hypothetical protein
MLVKLRLFHFGESDRLTTWLCVRLSERDHVSAPSSCTTIIATTCLALSTLRPIEVQFDAKIGFYQRRALRSFSLTSMQFIIHQFPVYLECQVTTVLSFT